MEVPGIQFAGVGASGTQLNDNKSPFSLVAAGYQTGSRCFGGPGLDAVVPLSVEQRIGVFPKNFAMRSIGPIDSRDVLTFGYQVAERWHVHEMTRQPR